MIRPKGFTIVELVVVMTIMAILLTLGVASFNSSQTKARDAEREGDVGTIAKGLEARYLKGNPLVSATYITQGAYPSVNEILQAENKAVTGLSTPSSVTLTQILPGTAINNFYPPDVSQTTDVSTTFKVICTSASAAPCNGNAAAENSATVTAALNGSTGVYIYEPIDASNNICFSAECVRYNLYYLPETGTMQTVASAHQ